MKNDNDYDMLDLERPTTSKAALLKSCSSNTDDIVLTDEEHQDDTATLWSIDDDTMFFPRGLMNHSAGKGKSVFVTWNENYLLNFVFKTSNKNNKTSLTKVRLSMPLDKSAEPEEIKNMLILELNTLLLMRSGRVYYFSSVKSIHPVSWLEDVRSITSCPGTQFSVIRFQDSCTKKQMPKQLLLEVYNDIAQLGKCPSRAETLRHSYDISFDVQNLFNCDWSDERYVLLSLITHDENIDFLRKLLAIASFLSSSEERVVIEPNQEVHIFTVSGNLFILVGALVSDTSRSDSNIEDYSINLLNTYATNIECIQIDFKKNLLMVLLQSGHLDVWYKSHRMFGSIQHLSHELSYFTHYDYDPCDNIFYITTPEEVTQIQIVYGNDSNSISECAIQEVHKAVCGIIACTWVENLQQLVCLSYNNIFYRLCFPRKANGDENLKEIDVKYENLQVLYALTTNKIKELLSKAQIIKDLMAVPAQLHDAIENEFQKQQLLAMGYKRKLWEKILHSHIEYHKIIPNYLYFDKDVLVIRAAFDCSQEENSIYALIYLSLSKTDSTFLSIVQTSIWYLEIFCSANGESLLLHVPAEMLHKKICFIIKCNASKSKDLLPEFTMNLRTFLQHCSQYVCINIDVDVLKNDKTYCHIFTNGVQQLALLQCHHLDPKCLIRDFKQKHLKINIPSISNIESHVKQVLKITKMDITKILEPFNIKYDTLPICTSWKLYFLQLYPLHLNYDENLELLTVTAEHLESLFYFKMYIMYQIRSSRKTDNIDLTESSSEHLKIMQLQADVERIYGSLLLSPECRDVDSGTSSLHLENLLKVYLKLRCEFNEIFR